MTHSLKKSLLLRTIMPIVLLAVVAAAFTTHRVAHELETVVSHELSNTAHTVEDALDLLYPGEYAQYGDKILSLAKGEYILNDQYELIDSISKDSGLEISIFSGNIRFLTTLTDEEGNRLVGTYAHTVVNAEVLSTGTSKFYNSTVIGNKKYYTYYLVFPYEDGSYGVMIAVAKDASEVTRMIYSVIWPILVITIIVSVLGALNSISYSNQMVRDMGLLQNFMKEVSQGNLKATVGYELTARKDELSQMADFATTMQKSLRELIELDALTGLDNRRSGNRIIEECQRRLVEYEEPYVLVLGDIDFFKKVNDTYGHEAGDEILRMVSEVLKKRMKGHGTAVRWGGEEFILIFPDAQSYQAMEVVSSILEEIRSRVTYLEEKEIRITMSYGIAKAYRVRTMDENIKAADDHLYYAKEHGRNQIVDYIEGEVLPIPEDMLPGGGGRLSPQERHALYGEEPKEPGKDEVIIKESGTLPEEKKELLEYVEELRNEKHEKNSQEG